MKINKAFFGNTLLNCLKILTFTVLTLVLFTQCAVKRPAMTTGIVEKVALMSTSFNFIQQAGISGPAAVARGQFNNRSDEINSLMVYYIDSLHHAVATNLRTQLGCDVIYGEQLHNLPQYKASREKYQIPEALNKEDINFPEILISSGDFNFTIAETKDGIMGGGKTVSLAPDILKETVTNMCRELGIEHIALSEFVFTGFKQSIFFAPDLYLRYNLYLYNKEGDLIAFSSNVERTVKIFESDMTGSFKNMIKSYLDKSELISIQSVFDRR